MNLFFEVQWIELLSALLCIVGVWLNAKPHVLGWPIGILSVLLASVVYFESKLFAEFGLQIFYTFSGFYGWWKWRSEKQELQELTIHRISKKHLWFSLMSGIFLSLVIGFILKNHTSGEWPWIDSGLTAFSLVGQIWMARKFLENWLLWMAINLISIGLYGAKGLWYFMGLYAILFLLAGVGYKNWRLKTI